MPRVSLKVTVKVIVIFMFVPFLDGPGRGFPGIASCPDEAQQEIRHVPIQGRSKR